MRSSRDHPRRGDATRGTTDSNPQARRRSTAARIQQSSGQQQEPTGHNNNPWVVRPRADSAGSTRGAFYTGAPSHATHMAPLSMQEIAVDRSHHSNKPQTRHSSYHHDTNERANLATTHRLSQQNEPSSQQPRASSMADMAALALESLEPGDMQPLNSTQPFAQPYHDDNAAILSTKATAARRALLQSRRQQRPMDHPDSIQETPPTTYATSALWVQRSHSDDSLDDSLEKDDANQNFKYYTHRQGSELLGDSLLESPAASSRLVTNNNNPQQNEIDYFSRLVQSSSDNPGYGAVSSSREEDDEEDDGANSNIHESTIEIGSDAGILQQIQIRLDPTEWLRGGADEDGAPYYGQRYTLAALIRHLLYNPYSPEFTSLQLFNWSILIGIFMGLYTAGWKMFIDMGVVFFWDTVPQHLMEWGVFTELDGAFPIYHYMWICPALFGGLLSCIFVQMPHIPDQNQWITSIHTRGVLDHDTLVPLFLLSTMGMWSGLSLGPELPLVLTAGMVGSWLGLQTQQSMLQARVLNMTAASAAVGGFFGFPMAGALFVLEIPHRMGLQYFEALSPGTIASIVAVLVNRMVTGNDVTGYYKYPFLTTSLPSSIFSDAIVYGLYGSFVGILYAHGTKYIKGCVNSWFSAPHSKDHGRNDHDLSSGKDKNTEIDITVGNGSAETVPLISVTKKTFVLKPQSRRTLMGCVKACFCLVLPNKAHRATVAGIVAGAMVGVVGIFVPHTLFWGEAQLQNLIDKGRTPLPVFGQDNSGKATAGFLAHAMCMIDPADKEAIRAGFNLECSALIAVAKVIVIGLSLGTGIIGGHFWGPLFVGCVASHFFSDLVKIFDDHFGFGGGLATYPCVVILCTMGSAHVVTFRAHMAIMLILTLTISAFDPEDVNSLFEVAGDYSAVFPLLVVSVFISLMTSRDTVFYPTQRSRGDITAVPEVLCQPGMSGTPLVVVHEQSEDWSYDDDDSSGNDGSILLEEEDEAKIGQSITQNDIENAFEAAKASGFRNVSKPQLESLGMTSVTNGVMALVPAPVASNADTPTHRRVHSAPLYDHPVLSPSRSNHSNWESVAFPLAPPTTSPHVGSRSRTTSSGSQKDLMRVQSFGEIQQHQPSLMDQARLRAASSAAVADLSPPSPVAGSVGQHRRVPSLSSNSPGASESPVAGSAGQHRRVPSLPSNPPGASESGRHHRIPSLPMASRGRSHSRQNSQDSSSMLLHVLTAEPEALSVTDIQFVNDKLTSKSPWSTSSKHSRQNSQNSPSMMPNALGAEPGASSAEDIQLVNEKLMSKSSYKRTK